MKFEIPMLSPLKLTCSSIKRRIDGIEWSHMRCEAPLIWSPETCSTRESQTEPLSCTVNPYLPVCYATAAWTLFCLRLFLRNTDITYQLVPLSPSPSLKNTLDIFPPSSQFDVFVCAWVHLRLHCRLAYTPSLSHPSPTPLHLSQKRETTTDPKDDCNASICAILFCAFPPF